MAKKKTKGRRSSPERTPSRNSVTPEDLPLSPMLENTLFKRLEACLDDKLEKEIDAVNDKITEIDDKVSGLKNDVSAVQSAVDSALDTKISDLKADLVTKDDITELNSRLAVIDRLESMIDLVLNRGKTPGDCSSQSEAGNSDTGNECAPLDSECNETLSTSGIVTGGEAKIGCMAPVIPISPSVGDCGSDSLKVKPQAAGPSLVKIAVRDLGSDPQTLVSPPPHPVKSEPEAEITQPPETTIQRSNSADTTRLPVAPATHTKTVANSNLDRSNSLTKGKLSNPQPHRQYEPRPFDGSGATSWAEYLHYFRLTIDRNQWSTQEAGLHLACCMKDRALKVLCEMDSDKSRDFDAIVHHFDERFGSGFSLPHYRTQFEKFRPMGGTESPTDYCYALTETCARAYPRLGSAAWEELCLEKFINGLPTLDMRRHLRMAEPETLKQAIQHVDRYMSAEVYARDKARKPHETNAIVVAQATGTGEAEPGDIPGGAKGKPVYEMANVLKELAAVRELLSKLSVPENPPHGKRKFGNRKQCGHCKSYSHAHYRCPEVVCFTCKNKGHIQRNCPTNENSNLPSRGPMTNGPTDANDLNSKQRV